VPVAANPHVGAVLPLSVTALERWDRCRRQYLLRDLLAVPSPPRRAPAPTDVDRGTAGADPSFGLAVHHLLEAVHREEVCGDANRTHDLAREIEPAAAAQLATLAARHAGRCPGTAADWSAHEYGTARFNRRPDPLFMLTGRIDALWAHGGVLAAHDYKTGAPRVQRLGDLLAARVQAWLLAPLAAERGLRVRIVFEHLDTSVHDQPDPYEPEDEDLAAIGDELRAIASAVRDETRFTGSGDPADCRWCAYRPV
jgi:hypothetical protein